MLLRSRRAWHLSRRMAHHGRVLSPFFQTESAGPADVIRLISHDKTNRLTRACVQALTAAIEQMKRQNQLRPLILAGNSQFFSVGADLNEINALTGPEAYEFSAIGQRLMRTIETYRAPVIAAVEGHCMGGGLDLALACHRRISCAISIFGHRGAALGLMTGWGGTQRLPRLIGRARALELFIAAEKISAARALEIGLVEAVVERPVEEAIRSLQAAASISALV